MWRSTKPTPVAGSTCPVRFGVASVPSTWFGGCCCGDALVPSTVPVATGEGETDTVAVSVGTALGVAVLMRGFGVLVDVGVWLGTGVVVSVGSGVVVSVGSSAVGESSGVFVTLGSGDVETLGVMPGVSVTLG